MNMGQNEVRVKIPLRSRGWMLRNREMRHSRSFENQLETDEDVEMPSWRTERLDGFPLTRFLLLSYFPSGFWPRLMSRIRKMIQLKIFRDALQAAIFCLFFSV